MWMNGSCKGIPVMTWLYVPTSVHNPNSLTMVLHEMYKAINIVPTKLQEPQWQLLPILSYQTLICSLFCIFFLFSFSFHSLHPFHKHRETKQMTRGWAMLLESSYLGFQTVMDNKSIRPNGVKSPNTITLRTHHQQQELALNHMKGEIDWVWNPTNSKGKIKTEWDRRWRLKGEPTDTGFKGQHLIVRMARSPIWMASWGTNQATFTLIKSWKISS